jgi:hypothetical protein
VEDTQKSCKFIVKGNSTFIHEFEKMLEENKITYSKLQLEKPIVQINARGETEKGVEREDVMFHSVIGLLLSKETIGLLIVLSPKLFDLINRWYTSRKKKGEKGQVSIRTKQGTYEISAESIKKIVFIEGETRQSTKRKKVSRTKNKQDRNLKSAHQRKKN